MRSRSGSSGNPGVLGQILDLLVFGHRPDSYTLFRASFGRVFFVSFLLFFCQNFSPRICWGVLGPLVAIFGISRQSGGQKWHRECLASSLGPFSKESNNVRKLSNKVRYQIFRVRQNMVSNKSRI